MRKLNTCHELHHILAALEPHIRECGARDSADHEAVTYHSNMVCWLMMPEQLPEHLTYRRAP